MPKKFKTYNEFKDYIQDPNRTEQELKDAWESDIPTHWAGMYLKEEEV